MTEIAVINYGPANNYAGMLPEVADHLYVFSHHQLENTAKFAHYEFVPDCEFVPYAELKVRQLANDIAFTHVVTNNEYDLERAGRLRDHLGLPGQSEASALSFRDKVVMKQLASAKVRTPQFAALDSIADLLDFIADHSYPVVVKPRKQGGSRDIVVIGDDDDLIAFSRRHWRDDLMIEEFVDGDVYHVDAIVAGGYRLVSCARYLRSCLGVMSGQNNGSIQLHPRERVAGELESFLDDVLAAFDRPATGAYHLEVFRTRSGELLLCEIASRVGGARIPAITRATYGVDLLTTWLRLSCGLPVEPAPSAWPSVLHAAVAIVPQGRPVRAPARPPFGWVTEYEVNSGLPQDAMPQNSTSNLCYAVVNGADSAELEQRLLEVEGWLLDNLIEASPE